jgi:hypothetical protein
MEQLQEFSKTPVGAAGLGGNLTFSNAIALTMLT